MKSVSLSASFLGHMLVFLAFLWLSPFLTYALPDKSSKTEFHKKRRRGGGGDFEVFRNNLDFFAGPSFNMASGDFISNQVSYLKSNDKKFEYTSAPKKNLINFIAGLDYRLVTNPKADGFASYLSYGIGLFYQRRGFSQELTMINKNFIQLEDKTSLIETYRASYISLPVSIRVGKKVFGEVGVTLDFLAFGTLQREMYRGTFGDSANVYYYGTSDIRDFKTGKVQPAASLGYCFGAGYEFNEHFGARLFGTFGNNYFTKGEDFNNLQISIQIIGTLNN